MTKPNLPIVERLRKYIEIKESGCHIWTGASTKGYGVINIDGHTRRVSRLIYALAYGLYDDSMHILHRCDTPQCVNPTHLFLGTDKDNAKDKLSKGRPNGGGPKRVTRETVEGVKRDYIAGFSWKELTKKYKGGTATIHRILKGVYDD